MTTKTLQAVVPWRIRLSKVQIAKLKKLAQSEGRSVTKQVAKILEEALNGKETAVR